MLHRCQRRRNPAKGFTLLELGIVLGVTAILAAAVLPDFIQSARGQMAEKAAEDVFVIEDLARWYFSQSLSQGAPWQRGRWPGQANPMTCSLTTDAFDVLRQENYLPTAPKNPWGQPYIVSVEPAPPSGGGILAGCLLQVATDVPKEIRGEFRDIVPWGHCNGENEGSGLRCKGSPTNSDFARCCSFIPKPGVGTNPCDLGNASPGAGSVLTCP